MNLPALRRGTDVLFARHETEPSHPIHVAQLATELFDALGEWHGFGELERGLLSCAAKLHDIGWAVTSPSGSGHHKASARLICEHNWEGVDAVAVFELAAIARYHRKALPSADHRIYGALNEDARTRVRRLGGIVRVADGLDRRHLQAVRRVFVHREPARWIVTAAADQEVSAELAAAKSKSDLLAAEAGVPLEFQLHHP